VKIIYRNIIRKSLFHLLILIPSLVTAQQGNDTLNSKFNFSRSWQPVIPIKDPAQVISLSRTTAEVLQKTGFYDGLGRSIQSVEKKMSPLGNDIVEVGVYDSVGRQQYGYLPYISPTATGDGKTNAFTEQTNFYSSMFSGESSPFTQVIYEFSPLNRTIKSLAPGNSWIGAGRGPSIQYLVNSLSDSVRIWEMAADNNTPVTTKIYSAGELFKNVQTDENGAKSISYIDRRGKTVLSKIQLKSNPGNGHVDWLCSYNVYDDMGNLRFTIPPLGVKKINGNWSISSIINLCTQYKYDDRNRLVTKEAPDEDSTENVYDVRNRLVFSRDGNLRGQNLWEVTFYDDQNRITMTGLYNSSATRLQLQGSMNTASTTQTITYTVPGIADLATAVNNTNSYQATNSVTWLDGFNSGDGATITAEIVSSLNGGNVSVTANNPLPTISVGLLTPLKYRFYDNYNFNGNQPALTGDFTKPQSGGDANAEPATATSNMLLGMPTGNKIRVIGTDQWLTTTMYYNDKGRLIQSIADNISGGSDITTNLYNFQGTLLSTYLRHNNNRSGVSPQTTVLTIMGHDNAGRLVTISKQLNDDGNNKIISRIRYNELGKPKSKILGANIDSLEFDYNIRGWLKNINKGYAVNGTTEGKNHHFGEQLFYDSTYSTPAQYNGNLSGVRWRGYNDATYRSYQYAYDLANRMLKADFADLNTSSSLDFSVKMGDGINTDSAYDVNGNILSMNQRGVKAGGSTIIDSLRYTYQANSNRLQGVIDKANDPYSTLGDFKEVNGNSNNDYSYDVNGNLVKDDNKGITSITYNYLNLPELIKVRGKGTVKYIYDASGNKLREIIVDSTIASVRTITKDYINGFVYQNDSLQFFNHEEGRVRMVYKTNTTPTKTYDYFVPDHLGNIRSVLTEQSDFSMYAATMETESAGEETALFSNVDETRTAKPVGYPQTDSTQRNSFVAKLNAKADGKKIGPSLVLRVMAGDTIIIGANAFYKSEGPAEKTKAAPVEDMVAALAGVFGDVAARDAAHNQMGGAGNGTFTGNFYNNEYQHLKEKDPDGYHSDKPKAYLNFALFDDQFKMVDDNSGVRQVKGAPDELQTLAVDKMVMSKSGFLYVYTSNETPQDVYFDNLIVTDITGPVLEETHYYPFGLVMDGISSRALGKFENRYLYQGKELQRGQFNDGTGLEWYNFGGRYYDPQLGRWFSLDPASQDYSPYMAMGNRPMIVVDPDGRFWHILIGGVIGGAVNLTMMAMHGKIHDFPTGLMAFGIGFAAGAVTAATGGAVAGILTGVGAEAGVSGAIALGAGGFSTGAVSGAVSAGAGGFIQGTGNAMVFGEASSWKDAINQGAKEGLAGMAFGAVTGGVTNGIFADLNGRSFWDGKLIKVDIKPVETIVKTYTYAENLDRADVNPIFKLGPAKSGVAIEQQYSKTVYAGYTNTPYAKTIDFSNGSEIVSMKTSMAEYLNIKKNILELEDIQAPFKTLHIVTPAGHMPANYTEIVKFASEHNIMVVHDFLQ